MNFTQRHIETGFKGHDYERDTPARRCCSTE